MQELTDKLAIFALKGNRVLLDLLRLYDHTEGREVKSDIDYNYYIELLKYNLNKEVAVQRKRNPLQMDLEDSIRELKGE